MRMRTLGRWTAWAGMIAALSLPLGCNPAGVRETRSSVVGQVANKPLHVKSVNGAINVTKGTTDSVLVTARICAQNEERLKATQIIAERLADGTLSVKVKWPDDKAKGDEGVSFDIALPDAHDLQLDTSNGAISVAGMAGEADLRTCNGSITVQSQDGAVKARTSNGGIRVADATGPIDADSSNGGVDVKNGAGAVKVTTSNGAIDVAMRREA